MGQKSDRLARMVANYANEGEMNRAIHIWEDPGFIYVSNPICACSTLKLSLNLTVAQVTGRRDFALTDAHQIHDRKANLLKTPAQVGYPRFEAMLDDPAIPVFSFVRSPESRLLSAFRKKLMRETPFTRRIRAYLSIPEDVPLKSFLTPDAFAERLAEDEGLRDLDGHWRLQRKQISYDVIPFTTFGRVESFATDAPRIFTAIFGAGNYTLRDAVTLNPANASGNRAAAVTLSETSRAAIARAYAQDQAMLDEIGSAA